jgi:hypothetical protein
MDTNTALSLLGQLLSVALCFSTSFGAIYTLAFYIDGSEDYSHIKDAEQRERLRRYGWYAAAATIIFAASYIITYDFLMGV